MHPYRTNNYERKHEKKEGFESARMIWQQANNIRVTKKLVNIDVDS